MKKIFTILASYLLVAAVHGQATYEVLADSANNNEKMLKGLVTKEDISSEPLFMWYGESQRIYSAPDTAAVNALSRNKNKIYFIIFGGTWCEDTHYVLPKFFKIQEASGFPENRITLFAVDRHKKTLGTIAQAMGITNVPTIIVMENGKEKGRIVEYGKTGKWDKELTEIINGK
ncbi:MAG: thioredoxin family protein [Bacteroidetes bacterium]|nr:thioredoxin family protein [Bacteroidota bacterium]